jgi:hypothetical protein
MEVTKKTAVFAQFRTTRIHYSSIQFSFSVLSGILIPTRNVSDMMKKTKMEENHLNVKKKKKIAKCQNENNAFRDFKITGDILCIHL